MTRLEAESEAVERVLGPLGRSVARLARRDWMMSGRYKPGLVAARKVRYTGGR